MTKPLPVLLWLDDERDPAVHYPTSGRMEVVWVKDFWEFKEALHRIVTDEGKVLGRIHFDWYLGFNKLTGLDCVRLVLEEVDGGILKDHPFFRMRAHSSDREKNFEIGAIVRQIYAHTRLKGTSPE